MFPPRTKSAAVKKDMQILHGLLQTNQKTHSNNDNDDDTASIIDNGQNAIHKKLNQKQANRLEEERALLNAALDIAKNRVVVKRPLKAPPLGVVDDDDDDET
eukprot:5882692-Ditylum_brightwellii.AAC.1